MDPNSIDVGALDRDFESMVAEIDDLPNARILRIFEPDHKATVGLATKRTTG